jgi:hypothetical protein
MKWLTRFLCQHDYRFIRNIWGDEIIACGYKRSIWQCSTCGKRQWRDNLVQRNVISTEALSLLDQRGSNDKAGGE